MAIASFPDVPSFRGWDGSKYVYWTTADAQPGGISDVIKMPLQGISGSINPYNINGMLFWYRADFGVERDPSNFVTTWKDLSGNGYHVGHSSTGPTFTTASLLNSAPSVRFDGSNNSTLTGSIAVSLNPRALTVFVMGTMGTAENPSWNTYNTFVGKTNSGAWTDGWCLGSRDTSSACSFWFNGWNNFVQKTGYVNLPIPILATGRAGPDDTLVYRSNRVEINKSITGSYVPSTTGPLTVGGAGGGYACTGHIVEIIAYDRALTDTEMYQVEQYLTIRYGLGTQ